MDIRMNAIYKAFGDQQVMQDFSCCFPAGRTTCIMGESGCGKTTLLNILLGLCTPDAGTVEGVPKGNIAVVFQEDRLCENLSAAANIRLTAEKKISDRDLSDAFRAVNLKEAGHKPVRELSGGMRRRVAVLRAVLAGKECIVMDEPLKGLDEETRRLTAGYIREKTAGRTLIVVTHDSEEIALFGAEQVLRMES
ncbi:ATP-binding cassette domain-containing protein [Roseburia hominis]